MVQTKVRTGGRIIAVVSLSFGLVVGASSLAQSTPLRPAPPPRPPVSQPKPPLPKPPPVKPQLGPPKAVMVRCGYSHSGPVDPIVMPGMATMSHNHEFFGNTTTNENSTAATLLAGKTTCDDKNDNSAYWVPSLFSNGVRVQPKAANVAYYLNGKVHHTAFPQGFKAISGRTNQTAHWACATPGVPAKWGTDVSKVPSCSSTQHLAAEIVFPECWDGKNVDVTDHKSHLVFPIAVPRQGIICPTDHPVRVPSVRLHIHYPKGIATGSAITLASGKPETLHADIFEAWKGSSLQKRINTVEANKIKPPFK